MMRIHWSMWHHGYSYGRITRRMREVSIDTVTYDIIYINQVEYRSYSSTHYNAIHWKVRPCTFLGYTLCGMRELSHLSGCSTVRLDSAVMQCIL